MALSHKLGGLWRSATLRWGALLTAVAFVLTVRLHSRHAGLVYPDGYQYLLMAKGVSLHLTPTLQLGGGGELFVPSVDASLKPLFPGLVALLSALFPLSLRGAANGIAVAAAAATVVLAGMLATRLTGSRAAGVVAALAALVSPALGFWSGFTGPDALAQVLVLATALALASNHASTAGVLGALCAATRPEWAVVLLSAALAALVFPLTRHRAGQALLSGTFTLAAVIALVRPPLTAPFGGLGRMTVGLAVSAALQLMAVWAGVAPRRAAAVVAAGLCGVVAVALSGTYPALAGLLGHEWPLLAVAAVGLGVACLSGNGRPALMLMAAALLLGATYLYRNPDSERYLTQLVPLACVAVGFAAAPPRRRPLARAAAVWLAPAVAAGAVALTVVVAPSHPVLAPDTFSALATQLADAPAGMLVSATPDAYGYLLPDRPQRPLRPGTRGLILLDAAQRTYAPDLTARGVVVARLTAPQGFERPDGTLDTGPAVLIRGVVVAKPRPG